MRINLNFGYNKLNLKEVVILIPKYHSNMVSFLTPILGLYGINVKEFINEFELKTKFINFDVVIPTSVKISKIKTFEISLKTPYIVPLLSNLEEFSLNKPNINVLSIYKVSLLKSLVSNSFLYNYHKNIYISLRKYISLVVKGTLDIKTAPRYLNFPDTGTSKILGLSFLKNNFLKFINLKKLLSNNYGVFVVFNNVSACLINTLKKSLSAYNIFLDKIQAKFASTLSGNFRFHGNIFFISSQYFNFYSIFYKEISGKTFYSNFLPVY
jgi:ribosomal protein L11